MSAGHPHRRPNHAHPEEVKHLLARADAPELMKRWQALDVDHDVADLAGYNVAGTVRYLDRDFFRALLDPDYATEILGEPIDTGMKPVVPEVPDTNETHEGDEKVLLDADNDVDTYLAAHEYATTAEHQMVRNKGGSPVKYERGLKKAIAFCEKKKLEAVDPDFACAPLLDDPDRNDHRALRELRKLGVADASKTAKHIVKYSRSTGEDRCDGCKNWEGSTDLGPDLSRCTEVCGGVRRDRWCSKFEEKTDDTGEQEAIDAQEAGDGEGDGLQAGGGRDRQEPQDQEPGSGIGGGNAQGQPGGEAQESKPQEGQVTS